MKTVSMVAGSVLLAAVASQAQAEIGISYLQSQVDSAWASQVGTNLSVHGGTFATNSYDASVNGAFPGTYDYDKVSTASAPSGLATGTGTVSAHATTGSFNFSGSGVGQAQWAAGAEGDVLYGMGNAKVTYNFVVPAGGPDHYLTLNGTASADPYTALTVRLSESNDGGATFNYLINDSVDGSQGSASSFSWSNQPFTLKAGYAYAMELYANTGYAAYADSTYPDPWTAQASFNLTGGVVPEPTIGLTMMGVTLAALSVRRRLGGKRA